MRSKQATCVMSIPVLSFKLSKSIAVGLCMSVLGAGTTGAMCMHEGHILAGSSEAFAAQLTLSTAD